MKESKNNPKNGINDVSDKASFVERTTTDKKSGSSIITQDAIISGAVKPRHLVPGVTRSGDLYYSNGGSFVRLPIGAQDTLLSVQDGIPTWAPIPAGSVTESDLSLSDVTTGNVTTLRHGFVPKAPNDSSKFLRGDATWNAVNMSSVTGVLPVLNGGTGVASLTAGVLVLANGTSPFSDGPSPPIGDILGTTDLQNVENKYFEGDNGIRPGGVAAQGDIWYSSDSSGTITRLPIDSDGYTLTLSSGLPSWQPAALPSMQQCFLYNSTDQTIANATDTELDWDGVLIDSEGWHTGASDITVTTSGLYLVTGYAFYSNGDSSNNQLWVEVNGIESPGRSFSAVGTTTSDDCSVYTSIPILLTGGDVLTIWTRQMSGGNADVMGGSGAKSSFFRVVKMSN